MRIFNSPSKTTSHPSRKLVLVGAHPGPPEMMGYPIGSHDTLPIIGFGRTRKLRVGLITPSMLFGGAEQWVAMLAAGLDDRRIRVAGVAVRDREHITPEIACKVAQRCPILSGTACFETLAAVSDVLIVWGVSDLAMLANFPGRVVCVGHGHCDWADRCIRSCLPYATDCAAVSRNAAQSFPEPLQVTILHNGIDTNRCAVTRTREAVRAEWGIRPGEIAIGHVGRLANDKNPLAVVHAAQALGKEYRAILVGGGMETTMVLQNARTIARDFIYRPPVDKVGDIYRALDCFVLASPSEGFSLALAEAWYCGCPTVSTPVGATELPELHGPLSVTVPVNPTPADLAQTVRMALAPANRQTVTRAAQVVTEHYTAEKMCARWTRYLLSLPRY